MSAAQTDAKKPKRSNAEGSVFFWQGRGWYAAVTGPDCRRIQRKAPKQTEAGAEQFLRKLLRERDAGELTRRSMTLEQFAAEWLRAVKRRDCRPRTLATYREKIELHVLPTLGRKRLDRITPGDVDRLYEERLAAGLSPTTVAAVHSRLHNLLKLAKRRRLVGQVATELVEAPRPRKYEARTLAVDEAKALLLAIGQHHYGALWTFILGTGVRFGEAAGLRWQDVELGAGVARLRQIVNRYWDGEHVVLSIDPQTKTDAGRRDVPLTGWVAAALERQRGHVAQLRLVVGDRWVERGLVFPNSLGGPLRENHVNQAWHTMLRTIGLEGKGQSPLRMHDLRHSKGTLMADEGEDLVVIQRTLGHARASTTADLYIGKVPKALRGAAERFDALLAPGTETAARGENPAEEASR